MKKELLFAFSAFFLMSLHAIAGAFTGQQEKPVPKIIETYEEDVTGSGEKTTIILKGIPFDNESSYLKTIWADVQLSKNSTTRIDYDPGYDPKIEFIDLNHDGVKDLLESSATGGSGGFHSYRLITLKDGKEKVIPMPPSLQIQGQFEDRYQASIYIPETNQRYKVDLSERKEDYDRLGIYKNGTLNEPYELMISPTSYFKPVKIKGKPGYGLVGYQQVSGAYHADGIGIAESYWYYENGKWQLLHVKWIPYNKQK
ncbi:hypothetical protein D9X91_07610 [Falsibacillus albus]|uniref:VCBS repeat-containing protein n=1 Tax=Falsibacillus albus TaxID=2478915 RepID=A0A3L7JZ38_9BACI|nr:hypothetical protein D9X91_07610 [Falsibacillus albus]